MLFASILVAATIKAGDKVVNLGASLIGVSSEKSDRPCPAGMIFIPSPTGGFCIDKYENSAGNECLFSAPANQNETRKNLDYPNCQPVSVTNAISWRHISQNQAATACAKAGKRLPTNKEWYQAALGTPDKFGGPDDCFLGQPNSQEPVLTGSRKNCVSSFGAFDMIGNVWEWAEETISDGYYGKRKVPEEGFVKSADNEGVAAETDFQIPDENYGKDYFWIQKEGGQGMFRGGYWGRSDDAGIYAIFAASPPSFAGNAVGFRCAK